MVVTEAMVEEMKNGSVIVDVSIDRGGCFETSEVTTHTDPVFKKYGVLHYCVPNIASRVPVSYTHLRAHETVLDLVCRLLLEKKKTILKHYYYNYTRHHTID